MDERYEILFGYKNGRDEWPKFYTDSLQKAVDYCRNYASTTNVEHDSYIYALDSETSDVVEWVDLRA